MRLCHFCHFNVPDGKLVLDNGVTFNTFNAIVGHQFGSASAVLVSRLFASLSVAGAASLLPLALFGLGVVRRTRTRAKISRSGGLNMRLPTAVPVVLLALTLWMPGFAAASVTMTGGSGSISTNTTIFVNNNTACVCD